MQIDQPELRRWVEATTGRAVNDMQRMPGGASRVSLRIDYAGGGSALLRIDTGAGPLSGTAFDLEREYRLLKALSEAGYAVPPMIGFNDTHNAILMGYIQGFNSDQLQLDPGRAAAQQRALLAKIVELQQLGPAASGLVADGWPRIGDALDQELDTWQNLYQQRVLEPQPVLDFCWRWLRENMPDKEKSATLVHGDVGPGNFLSDADGKILALIDWELAHVGHPLEDLACVLCRALGATFGNPAELVRWYGELSGHSVDRGALRYAIILVLARWSVGINMALSHPSVDLDVPMLLTFRQSNQHALLSQIAAHYRLEMPEMPREPMSDSPPSGCSSSIWFDYLIDNLDGPLNAACTENFVRYRMGGLAQVARYLRDFNSYGPEEYCREEQLRIETLLQTPFPGYAQARSGLAAAAVSGIRCADIDLVSHLLWWTTREHQLFSAAMGAMADRHIVW